MTDSGRARTATTRRSTVGGVIGNILEWYDFAVFGYFAPIIGAQFFPAEDHLAATIKAFGVFAAGYLMRPIGGVIFGHIGDRLGRKKALQLSVALMALPTFLLGLLPTYAQVGVTASALMIALRLIQGLSVGGELIGSVSYVTETAPPNRRGFYGSFSLSSAVVGVMLGSLVATIVHGLFGQQALSAWGWRLPFLAGLIIGLLGLWFRRGLEETPDFQAAKSSGAARGAPLVQAFRQMPGAVAHVAALCLAWGTGFYILFVWWPTYLTAIIKPAVPHALMVNTISMVALSVMIPVWGLLSDRVGRRPVMTVAASLVIIIAYPLFAWTDSGTFTAALVTQLMFAFVMSALAGPLAAMMVELFPARIRYTGIAVGYNFTLAIFGGTAPLVCTWLVSATGDLAAPAWYLIILAVVSLVAATAFKPHRFHSLAAPEADAGA